MQWCIYQYKQYYHNLSCLKFTIKVATKFYQIWEHNQQHNTHNPITLVLRKMPISKFNKELIMAWIILLQLHQMKKNQGNIYGMNH